ncbi:inositol monophosphatase family protein [Synoicihabitans lomoniglobus]|uniref:Inositol monophosphatase n=1 Tax=Synoicihabitans lomoniglobus TaxID=2909285 RepID=A0AAE9ZT95_9BACT|nr:inositol monophosphatase [Opitutaceae bacterium LMO-M01]WED63856.1 inositol monophosphatase [Opitutaceae bacterium LMO-M01]
MNDRQLERARRLLCQLQDTIRDALLATRVKQRRTFARVAAETAADTIYEIDRISEAALVAWLEKNWPQSWPVELVMEGLESELTFPAGTPVTATQWKLIIDPIDGTRGLMHDKRSAWALAGLAPQRGARNHLGDIVVAAMTELPISKQWRADQFSAVRGRGRVVATALNVLTGQRSRLPVRLSAARDFTHGFATIARFFPTAKTWLAQLEENLWRELGVLRDGGEPPPVFEDQYISSGGQLAEILLGRDRMVIDVRPEAFRALGIDGSGLSSHPYDLCTELLLREAGGVVERPTGGRLRDPLDTTSPVSFAAYANPQLARLVRPVLRRLLE